MSVLNQISENIDKADGGQNEIWHLARACSGLLSVVTNQQVQIDALRAELAEFKAQVTAAVPSAGSLKLCFCGKVKLASQPCCADCHHHGQLADLETAKWLG